MSLKGVLLRGVCVCVRHRPTAVWNTCMLTDLKGKGRRVAVEVGGATEPAVKPSFPKTQRTLRTPPPPLVCRILWRKRTIPTLKEYSAKRIDCGIVQHCWLNS